jgi:pyruvate dehydrogenase E2 component (dihydrolipoyllysine-residue acetyltransferase)
MKVSVLMPQLGLTMTEGTVCEWIKQPGDKVEKGEFLLTVSTDKADMEVESMTAGTLSQIVVEAGNTVPVGSVIAYIERPGGKAVATELSAEAAGPGRAAEPAEVEGRVPAPQSQAPVRKSARSARSPASPRARRVAKELGVDIATVRGTGTEGRIVEDDVRRAAQRTGAQRTDECVRRRRLIAEKMVESVQTIPHFTLGVEANAEALLALQESMKDPAEDAVGIKSTVTDVLLKALAAALEEMPKMNAVWENGKIRPHSGIDLGLAVATEEGVVGPVIHGVNKLDLGAITRRRSELVEKAHQHKLSLRDMEGGVGTLSNLGMYQVDQFQAIITPGQSFVLAVGQIRKRPWVEGAALTVRSTIVLTLSVDHRVADGAEAAKFIRKVAGAIEDPYRIQ